MISSLFRLLFILLLGGLSCLPTQAQRQMETLNRGLIAIRKSSTQVYLGWRRFGDDPPNIAFNLYRSANGGAAVKLNGTPLSATTDYTDSPGSSNLSANAYSYFVRPILNGVEQGNSETASLGVNAEQKQFFTLPLRTDTGPNGPYDVKFCWVGDLDGDGDYDYVVDRLSTLGAHEQFIEAYQNDGTFLWRMAMGPNSVNQYSYEPGSSAISVGDTDNVTVYDMDGDGKAEVLVRTADGVRVTNAAGVEVALIRAANSTSQFLSVIEGASGVELGRAPLPNAWAVHGTLTNKAMIAYLDGKRPSVVMYGYNRADSGAFYRQFTAWNFRAGALTQLWTLAQNPRVMPGAEGHQVRIADVDNDGKDEVCDIGHVIDDDGTQLFVTELTHGDRFHVADLNPDRPGLETFAIQQYNPTSLASALYESGTGKMIKKWYSNSSIDVGRGIALDLSAAHKGYEMYTTQPGIFNARGEKIYTNNVWAPEGIWWDGDLGREFMDGAGSGALSPTIDKFSEANGTKYRLFSIYNDWGSYSTRQAYGGRPAFWGDLFGDWREEVVLIQSDYAALRIYTSHTPAAPNRIYTLMHNPQYRCQATTKGYVQASYVDYYLGYGMSEEIPPPPMVEANLTWASGTVWETGGVAAWKNATGQASTYTQGDSVLFDLSGSNASSIALNGMLTPSAVAFFNPQNFILSGTGSLAGGMSFQKSGAGVTTLTGTHGFTGPTTIWDGALQVDGQLSSSAVTVWGGTWGGAAAKGQSGGRLAGVGTIRQAVTVADRGAVTPGSGMNSPGNLRVGSLSAKHGAVLALDLSDDPSGLSKANDRITVEGNLSLSGTVTLHIQPLNGTLAVGNYTLLTYGGTLTGTAANLAVNVPEGTIYSLSVSSGAIVMTIPATRAPTELTWLGGQSGNVWDLFTTPNWSRVGGGVDRFVSGDAVRLDAIGSANPSINLKGTLLAAGVTVDSSSDYQISGTGAIAGAGGLTKLGTGTLTLANTNTYTGPTAIRGGILEVQSLGDAGSSSSIGAAGESAANLVIDGGKIALLGEQTSSNRSISLGASGAGLVVPGGVSLQISGRLSGTGSLTKEGAGTLILASSNTYSGGTVIAGGTLQLASDGANVSGLGGGLVTLEGGTLAMANNDDVSSAATSQWSLHVPQGAVGRLNADGRCTLAGSLSGSGDFTFYTPFVRTALTGNWSSFSGNIWVVSDADGGDFRIETTAGYASARLDLGQRVNAYYNVSMGSNVSLAVGTLSGASTSSLRGGPSAGRTLTWQVGARNEDSVFAGVIANSSSLTALTKIGSGTLALSGANTYTGPTSISAGRLQIHGSSTGSAFTVQSGGTLGGTGVIYGDVTVLAGGAIEHGGLSTAALTINGNLTLSGSVVVRPAAGGMVAGNYTVLTYTGSLTGSPSFVWDAPTGSNLQASFDSSTPGVIRMSLVEMPRYPGAIFWSGSRDFNWDQTSANWMDGESETFYQIGDSVYFTDAGNAESAINLVENVQPAAVVVNATKNYVFSGNGVLTDSATLEKSGGGTLTLTRVHSFTGTTTLSGGILSVTQTGSGSSAVGAALGSGGIVLSGGGDFRMGSTNGRNFPNNEISLPPGAHGTLSSVSLANGHGGMIKGGADSILRLSGPISVGRSGLAQFGDFSGQVEIPSGSQLRFASTSGSNGNGGALTSFQVDGVISTRNAGGAGGVVIGALSGAGRLEGQSNSPAGTVTYFVGAKGVDSSFSGSIVNGGNGVSALHKLGGGELTLSGLSSYSGATTVAAGKLTVTGALQSSATTVQVGGTLGGTGSLGAAVSCNGTLAPGVGVGTLEFSSGLNFAATSALDFELGSSSDQALVTGSLRLDGILNVTAVDGFGAGNYTLIRYSGALTDNGLEIGRLPSGYLANLSFEAAGEVRLIVSAINQVPQIEGGIMVDSIEVSGSSSVLAVLASDDGGEGNLTYRWSATGPASVMFLDNLSNSAKVSTAVFSEPGAYTIVVEVQDPGALSASASLELTVRQTATSLRVSADSSSLVVGDTLAFSAELLDQFGAQFEAISPMWSVSGGGGISADGVFSASQAGGPYWVTAVSAGVSSSFEVMVGKALGIVSLGDLVQSYDGSPKSVSVSSTPSGLSVNLLYDGESEAPTEVGSYTVQATLADSNYQGTATAVLVIENPVIRDFGSWVAGKFNPSQISAGESAPMADPDGDGMVNLAEYALGGDPYGFTSPPTLLRSSEAISINFQRPLDLSDIRYHAEVSSNLEDWTALTLEVVSGDAQTERVRATYPLPSNSSAPSFMRLRFEK
jgi:fibronectin-binding autotransporter adhesin